MNSADAKKVLIACRPGTEDVREPVVLAALEQTQRDPELQRWWEQQQAFQESMRESFRAMPVPGSLRSRIRAQARVVKVTWWRAPVAWSAAAALAILVTFFATRSPSSRGDSFQTFRARMVGNVLRQYSMTIVTNDMASIREHLATNNAPADYSLPQALSRLPVMGAGVLSWQDRRVSMVCLDGGTHGTVFLFVVDGSSVKNPPQQREYAPENSLVTAGWTEGGKTYVLAGTGEQEWLRSLF